jgi:hypothetical protein
MEDASIPRDLDSRWQSLVDDYNLKLYRATRRDRPYDAYAFVAGAYSDMAQFARLHPEYAARMPVLKTDWQIRDDWSLYED